MELSDYCVWREGCRSQDVDDGLDWQNGSQGRLGCEVDEITPSAMSCFVSMTDVE